MHALVGIGGVCQKIGEDNHKEVAMIDRPHRRVIWFMIPCLLRHNVPLRRLSNHCCHSPHNSQYNSHHQVRATKPWRGKECDSIVPHCDAPRRSLVLVPCQWCWCHCRHSGTTRQRMVSVLVCVVVAAGMGNAAPPHLGHPPEFNWGTLGGMTFAHVTKYE